MKKGKAITIISLLAIVAAGAVTFGIMSKIAMEKDELYWHFITKRAIMTNQVLISWAKECIKELEDSIL